MITIFCSNGTDQEYEIMHFDDNQIMVSHQIRVKVLIEEDYC